MSRCNWKTTAVYFLHNGDERWRRVCGSIYCIIKKELWQKTPAAEKRQPTAGNGLGL